MPPSPLRHRVPEWRGVDWSHPRPTPVALVVALVVALAGSLAADRVLVALGDRLFPAVRSYGHFRFSDYATLTVIGVVVAGGAWPVVCRISPSPRRLYLRAAVVVTVVLWLPDLYLILDRQPGRAVAVLMVMHVAVAAVTYQAMVRVAPPRALASAGVGRSGAVTADTEAEPLERAVYRGSLLLAGLVAVEFALGIATLVAVPTGRASGWWPGQGRLVYLAHALVGLPLALLAILFLTRARESTRLHRLSGWIGASGVAVAGLGGLLTAFHPLRLVGVGLMLAGPVTAGFGYLIPWFDRLSDDPPEEAAEGEAAAP
jgi:hypothetical protein